MFVGIGKKKSSKNKKKKKQKKKKKRIAHIADLDAGRCREGVRPAAALPGLDAVPWMTRASPLPSAVLGRDPGLLPCLLLLLLLLLGRRPTAGCFNVDGLPLPSCRFRNSCRLPFLDSSSN